MPRGVYFRTEEARRNISRARRGKPSPTKGLKWSMESRARLSNALRGDRGSNWSGDGVGYSGVHKWLYKELGRADSCHHQDSTCKGRFEWANVSGEYRRRITDWVQLCKSHHLRYDDRTRDINGRFIKEKTWRAS